MKRTYLNYEYEKEDITEPGDDFRRWHYRITNVSTRKIFSYIVEITKSALSSKPEELELQEALNSSGDSVVEKSISQKREDGIVFIVDTKGIKSEVIKKGGLPYEKLIK